MSSPEVVAKPADKLSPQPHSDAGTANALHQAVFNSPDEYLKFLQHNYKTLSRGDDNLSLQGLQIDSKDASLPSQLRDAAKITAAHYNDLLTLGRQDGTDYRELNRSSLSSADDWVSQNVLATTGYAIKDDVIMGVGSAVAGFSVSGLMVAATADFASTSLAAAAVTFVGLSTVGVAVAVGGIALGVNLGGRAVQTYNDTMTKGADEAKEVSSWLRS